MNLFQRLPPFFQGLVFRLFRCTYFDCDLAIAVRIARLGSHHERDILADLLHGIDDAGFRAFDV